MQGVLTFLLIAAVFYMMMRAGGCGGHSHHGGHDAHEGHQHGDGGSEKDPVCGMPVPPDKGYSKQVDGKTVRFCSRNCLDKFEANPESYHV